MCGTCGCSDLSKIAIKQPIPTGELALRPEGRAILIEQDIMASNDQIATSNRQIFDQNGVFTINLMSSPGSGKTSLPEKSLPILSHDFPVHVIEGDQATQNDAERIKSTGCSATQIVTGTTCHLGANMIKETIINQSLKKDSILFIENVGNLVCPAMFNLGEHEKVVITSVTEGEDKPEKYPHMFQSADLILLNKVDLLEYLDFSTDNFIKSLRKVNEHSDVILISAKTGEGINRWHDWIFTRRQQHV